VGWIMRDEPKRLDFDRMNDALEQIPKLPEVATKAPPVGRQRLANRKIGWVPRTDRSKSRR
jgi:hypothetical protein